MDCCWLQQLSSARVRVQAVRRDLRIGQADWFRALRMSATSSTRALICLALFTKPLAHLEQSPRHCTSCSSSSKSPSFPCFLGATTARGCIQYVFTLSHRLLTYLTTPSLPLSLLGSWDQPHPRYPRAASTYFPFLWVSL